MTNTTLPKLTLIKAGAGSGKTFGIQEQLTEWVLEGKLNPEKILAVTFTNGGAAELRERIRANLLKKGEGKIDLTAIDKAQITTIHGFGLSLVERFAYAKGISPKPRQLNEAEQAQLIKNATAQLEEGIEPIIQNLYLYGYSGTQRGDKFVDKVEQFREDIFEIIECIRGLGIGANDGENTSAKETLRLIEHAQRKIKSLYAEKLKDAEKLNNNLWQAIQTLKAKYENQAAMMQSYNKTKHPDANGLGFNDDFRAFVEAIYQASPERISSDWKLWGKLQLPDEEKRANKTLEKHEFNGKVQRVFNAALELQNHPGPLKQAQEHAAILLQAAFDALATYQQGKANAGLLDFTDMVQLAQQIVNSKDYFAELKGEVDCLVIDEFQDTNPLQFSLLKPFMDAGIPTYIVGDLKQSIMGFQGADSRLFENLTKQNSTTTKLENWRSSTKVMTFVNQMASKLFDDYEPLTAKAKHKDSSQFVHPVRRIIFDSKEWLEKPHATSGKPVLTDEGFDFLVNEIHQLIKNEQQVIDKNSGEARSIKYSDIAVLAPKHKRLKVFAEKLRKAGIPAQLAEEEWHEADSVQLLLNALQYLNNIHDHYAALSLITNSFIGTDLKESLEGFYQNKHFQHPVLSKIKALRKPEEEDKQPLYWHSLYDQLTRLMDLLELEGLAKNRLDGEQQRADAFKLLKLASEFVEMPDISLEAMGVHGKNAQTFCAWIKKNIEEDNRKPTLANPNQHAVVLKTWHGSKGLEWPVVMVLDAHKENKAKLSNIRVDYANYNMEQMLSSGCIEFLPDMADAKTKEEFLKSLEKEIEKNQKNLVYVALTRAREQIILPWYMYKDGYKENSLCQYLDEPNRNSDGNERGQEIFGDKAQFEYKDIQVQALALPEQEQQKAKQLQLEAKELSAPLAATVSPSEQPAPNESEQASSANTQQHQYGEALDFKELEEQGLHANEIGTWMHRLYHVFLKNPENTELLETAMQLFPKEDITLTDDFKQKVIGSLTAFKHWLDNELQTQAYYCELPILATNELGQGQSQTISGTIDLLVETEQGYWIIDHKTDQKSIFSNHQQQLVSYAKALGEKDGKTVQGIAVNWVREANLEIQQGI